jgi:hypothetical protein
MTPPDSGASDTPELLKRLSQYEQADSRRGQRALGYGKDEYLSRLQALERLGKLRAAGFLTEAEFELAKTKIFGEAETNKAADIPSAWVWSQYNLAGSTPAEEVEEETPSPAE